VSCNNVLSGTFPTRRSFTRTAENSEEQRRLLLLFRCYFSANGREKQGFPAAKARAGRCKFWEKQQKTAGEPCAVVLG
jgi:hypothetical protein